MNRPGVTFWTQVVDSCKLILHLVCETNNTNQGQLSTEKCFFYFRSGTTFDKSHKHYVDANTKENTITNKDQKTIQLYCVFWCKIRKHQIKMYFLLRNAQIFQNQILSFETSKMGRGTRIQYASPSKLQEWPSTVKLKFEPNSISYFTWFTICPFSFKFKVLYEMLSRF